jgi:hypothetical protein
MKISTGLDLEGVSTDEAEFENSFKALPAGNYRVMISRASYAPTAAGTGFRIPLQLTVLGGDYTGRIIFEGLNVINPNETAQLIGKQRLAEILDALNIDRSEFGDTDQLEGGVVMAKVTRSLIKDPVQREQYGDDDGNENRVARFFGEDTKKAEKKKRSKADKKQLNQDLDEAPF